jgi:hypothetical protein
MSGDLHFGAMADGSFRERGNAVDEPPSRAVMEEVREPTVRRAFGPAAFTGPAYTAALSLLAGTDALILDLRRNGGGSPASVAYLMSHFFPLGDERHLIDIYNRPRNSTRQFFTVPTVAQRCDKPVYVLTSARTFSGGEDCAYDFQAQKRGTLAGETTGGGSNPIGWFTAGHGIVVSIPVARTTNVVTGTNWEHVGVKPDIAVPAAQVLQTAHVAILRNLVASVKDGDERKKLQRLLAMAEQGETEKPVYTLRGSGKEGSAHARCDCGRIAPSAVESHSRSHCDPQPSSGRDQDIDAGKQTEQDRTRTPLSTVRRLYQALTMAHCTFRLLP